MATAQITAQEHSAGAKAMFTKMDANKDGLVTAAEMDAAHHAMTGKDHGQMTRSEGDTSTAGDKAAGKTDGLLTTEDGRHGRQ